MSGAGTFDVAVVGGGPAGMAAAVWLARHRRPVVVLDAGEQRNRWVERSHGYLGSDPMHPLTFLETARTQLREYDEVELRSARVLTARRGGERFVLGTDAGDVAAARVVLATGVKDRFPEVGNFFEHYGTSVFHCPTCDGYEARGREVVAFGWTEEVTGFALTLLGWARSVTLVTDGRTFEGDEGCRRELSAAGIEVTEDDAVELLGDRGDLRGVRLRSGRTVACQLAFFSIAHEPQVDLAVALGCELTEDGCIRVDHEGATSVPGVYAAGDVTPGLQLVPLAVAEGTAAGVACALGLRGRHGS